MDGMARALGQAGGHDKGVQVGESSTLPRVCAMPREPAPHGNCTSREQNWAN